MATIKVCQHDIYVIYRDYISKFITNNFWAFKTLLGYENIYICINLFFLLNEFNFSFNFFLGIGKAFIMELISVFPTNPIMDALGVVYPQYWL